ncbi:MAG: hypothetical protein ACREAE_01235 [Nitrosopumilaceae archaeon]
MKRMVAAVAACTVIFIAGPLVVTAGQLNNDTGKTRREIAFKAVESIEADVKSAWWEVSKAEANVADARAQLREAEAIANATLVWAQEIQHKRDEKWRNSMRGIVGK